MTEMGRVTRSLVLLGAALSAMLGAIHWFVARCG